MAINVVSDRGGEEGGHSPPADLPRRSSSSPTTNKQMRNTCILSVRHRTRAPIVLDHTHAHLDQIFDRYTRGSASFVHLTSSPGWPLGRTTGARRQGAGARFRLARVMRSASQSAFRGVIVGRSVRLEDTRRGVFAARRGGSIEA